MGTTKDRPGLPAAPWYEIEVTFPPSATDAELAERARAAAAVSGLEARVWGHVSSDHRRLREGGIYWIQGPELGESNGSAAAGGVSRR